MFWGTPPVQSSAPPPVYCAECGCQVDPAAWLCATCGKNLHEPGAATLERLDAPATSKNSKPDFMISAEIFAILLIVGFFILDIGLRTHLIPAWIPGHPFGSPFVIYLIVIFVILWADISDRII
jgi:hypothetical protein